MKKGGLGRGLRSLISSRINLKEEFYQGSQLKKEPVFYIEVDKIKVNPSQPRKDFDDKGLDELAQSILRHGILQPLVVSKIEKKFEGGKRVEYQLIAGERRLRAAKKVGFLEVPAIIKDSNEKSRLEMALIENIQRKDLNSLEKAEAFEKLKNDYDFTHEKIAERIGKSREYVSNILRLLSLDEEIKKAIRENKINEGHARAILALKDSADQKELFFKILNNRISVRESEKLARKLKRKKSEADLSPYLSELIEKLEEKLGTRVNVVERSRGGKIVIDFYSDKDLESIVRKILNQEML